LIPLNFRRLSFSLSHFSDEVQLSDLSANHSTLTNLHQSISLVVEPVSKISSSSSVKVLSSSTSRVDLGLNLLLPIVENPSLKIKSFVVQIPRLAYSLETVDGDRPTTLLISNSPTEVELFDTSHPEINSVVSLDCISLSAGDTSQCSLLNGLNFEKFVDNLRSGRLSLRADSTPEYAAGERGNFLTNLLGLSHSLTVQPISLSESRRLTRSSSTVHTSDLVSPRDSRLTEASDCFVMTADSVYESLICSDVDKGFTMISFDLVDESGEIATIKSVTSWTPAGEFAFASDFEAHFRGGYLFTANASASNEFKNASLLLDYYESSNHPLHGNAFSSWSFPTASSQGNIAYSIHFAEAIGSSGDLISGGEVSYGNNNYHAQFAQTIALTHLNYNSTMTGSGRYGGNWTHWYVSSF
jgi:hypothetical protein